MLLVYINLECGVTPCPLHPLFFSFSVHVTSHTAPGSDVQKVPATKYPRPRQENVQERNVKVLFISQYVSRFVKKCSLPSPKERVLHLGPFVCLSAQNFRFFLQQLVGLRRNFHHWCNYLCRMFQC